MDLKLNPNTLTTESEEDRRAREKATEVLGNGLNVICRPDPMDPFVFQTQPRAVCLFRPYPTCGHCPHRVFTLSFNAFHKETRLEVVQCPKWENSIDRSNGMHPVRYESTEVATCEDKPFDFCPSCPSQRTLVQLGLDKTRPGWYGRYSKFTKEALDD